MFLSDEAEAGTASFGQKVIDVDVLISKPAARPPVRRGRSLKLYLVDGTPSGVITAELGVSSVKAAVASRTALLDFVRRDESGRTGCTFCSGPIPTFQGALWCMLAKGIRSGVD